MPPHPKFFEAVPGPRPEGFDCKFRMDEVHPIETKFKHNAGRNNQQLFDSIADDLRDGQVVPFPLGLDRHDYPFGISFSFEKQTFMLLAPSPDATPIVFLCAHENCSELTARRAGAFVANAYVTEYRRFYSTGEPFPEG